MTGITENKRLVWGLGIGLVVFFVLVYLVRSVLTPFAIAFALAYLLDPLADRLESWKLSRTASVVVLILTFFVAVTLAAVILIPVFRIQVEHLAQNLPDYIGQIEEWIHPYIEQLSMIDSVKIKEQIKEGIKKLGTLPLEVVGSASQMLWKSLASLWSLALMMVNLCLIPVAMFYLLRDFDHIKEKLVDLIPLRQRDHAVEILKEIDQTLSRFVRGQLMVATLMAGLYCIGLFTCGTPMSLFIGLLAGYANLIPYLGLILGLVPAVLLTFLQFQDWLPLLGVAGVFAAVQALEGMVITPRVVGDQLGLHPVAIMLAVLIGGELFGFVGILLGVPAAAVLNVLRRRSLKAYKESSLYKE